MRFNIISIGNKMPSWVGNAFQEYQKRFSPPFSIHLIEIPDKKTEQDKKDKKKDSDKNDKIIFSHIPKGAYSIALDEKGQVWNSEKFSKKIESLQLETSEIYFIIGGADGLSNHCLQNVRDCWSLSHLTFPHPLVRVILIEQLYRAVSLIKHHPYHRA